MGRIYIPLLFIAGWLDENEFYLFEILILLGCYDYCLGLCAVHTTKPSSSRKREIYLLI